jgi:dihydroneopterin aldolase
MQDPFASDAILINRLHVNTVVGSDCWGKKRPQPLIVSVRLSTSLQRPAETDDIQHTVNYGTLYKSIISELGSPLHEQDITCTLADIANGIVVRCIMPLITQREASDPILVIRIEAPKTLLSGALWGYEIQTQGLNQHHHKYFVKDLRISVIIGVNPPERLSKQVVELDLEFYDNVQPDVVDSLVKVRNAIDPLIHLTLFIVSGNYFILYLGSLCRECHRTDLQTSGSCQRGHGYRTQAQRTSICRLVGYLHGQEATQFMNQRAIYSYTG